MRSVCELRKHPAYEELRLRTSSTHLADVQSADEFPFRDPLLITSAGIVIDGYARLELAQLLGLSPLFCAEIDIDEEEALRRMLMAHQRSPGWNDFNRIRLASRLKDVVRSRARTNQQAGGRLKGSSNLTEANVRKAIAQAAGVCEGNVTKVDQLRNAHAKILEALETDEISINKAWEWRELAPLEQLERLRLT